MPERLIIDDLPSQEAAYNLAGALAEVFTVDQAVIVVNPGGRVTRPSIILAEPDGPPAVTGRLAVPTVTALTYEKMKVYAQGYVRGIDDFIYREM